MKNRTIAFAFLALTAATAASAGPNGKIDLDSYYHWPVSIAASYQPLSGMANRALADFDIVETSAEIRFSPRWAPIAQPFLTAGIVTYSFIGDLDVYNQDWTHRHFFAGLGLGFASRVSREFEYGVEGFGAVSQSYFADLSLPGMTEPQGQLNVFAGASARLALNPSYNVSIAVTPALRYLRGLGPLDAYDGFTFGVGFGASYRFGRDPDAPQSAVRAVRFAKADFPPLFAAMQGYYARKSAMSVTLTNAEKFPITDLSVSFMQAGFMDSPTQCGKLERLGPGESAEIPVLAAFNDQVFSTQGVTALTGELIVQYSAKGNPVEQRQSVTFDLYDKNALTWDDDRKAAAFITPQDSAVRNYASFIRQANKDESIPYLSKNLQFAMQAYDALSELGILYQVDPTAPFAQMQEDKLVVDSISLPRETLVRRTGDCDDLTVLFNTLLQTVGIQTALVTTPGHIYSAFNTEIPTRNYQSIHPDRNMMLDVDGELWVLVEITMIGTSDFMKAWNTGIAEFRRYDTDTRVRGFYKTGEAQTIYRPISLRESDLGLQYGNAAAISDRFRNDIERLVSIILQPHEERAMKSDTAKDWNAYGIAAAQLGSSLRAKQAFERSIKLERDNLSARLNLGSLSYLNNEYRDALSAFKSAEAIVGSRTRTSKATLANLFINLGKTYFSLADFDNAKAYYGRAQGIDPAGAARFAYLGSGEGAEAAQAVRTSDTGRGADAAATEPILFFED